MSGIKQEHISAAIACLQARDAKGILMIDALLKSTYKLKNFKKLFKNIVEELGKIAIQHLNSQDFVMSQLILDYLRNSTTSKLFGHFPEQKAKILNHFACFYRRKGQVHTALDMLNKALSLIEKYGLQENKGLTYLNICAILSQQKKYKQALNASNLAVECCQKEYAEVLKRDPIEQEKINEIAKLYTIALHNKAAQLEHLFDYTDALKFYNQSLEIAQEHDSCNQELHTYLFNSQQKCENKTKKQKKPLLMKSITARPKSLYSKSPKKHNKSINSPYSQNFHYSYTERESSPNKQQKSKKIHTARNTKSQNFSFSQSLDKQYALTSRNSHRPQQSPKQKPLNKTAIPLRQQKHGLFSLDYELNYVFICEKKGLFFGHSGVFLIQYDRSKKNIEMTLNENIRHEFFIGDLKIQENQIIQLGKELLEQSRSLLESKNGILVLHRKVEKYFRESSLKFTFETQQKTVVTFKKQQLNKSVDQPQQLQTNILLEEPQNLQNQTLNLSQSQIQQNQLTIQQNQLNIQQNVQQNLLNIQQNKITNSQQNNQYFQQKTNAQTYQQQNELLLNNKRNSQQKNYSLDLQIPQSPLDHQTQQNNSPNVQIKQKNSLLNSNDNSINNSKQQTPKISFISPKNNELNEKNENRDISQINCQQKQIDNQQIIQKKESIIEKIDELKEIRENQESPEQIHQQTFKNQSSIQDEKDIIQEEVIKEIQKKNDDESIKRAFMTIRKNKSLSNTSNLFNENDKEQLKNIQSMNNLGKQQQNTLQNTQQIDFPSEDNSIQQPVVPQFTPNQNLIQNQELQKNLSDIIQSKQEIPQQTIAINETMNEHSDNTDTLIEDKMKNLENRMRKEMEDRLLAQKRFYEDQMTQKKQELTYLEVKLLEKDAQLSKTNSEITLHAIPSQTTLSQRGSQDNVSKMRNAFKKKSIMSVVKDIVKQKNENRFRYSPEMIQIIVKVLSKLQILRIRQRHLKKNFEIIKDFMKLIFNKTRVIHNQVISLQIYSTILNKDKYHVKVECMDSPKYKKYHDVKFITQISSELGLEIIKYRMHWVQVKIDYSLNQLTFMPISQVEKTFYKLFYQLGKIQDKIQKTMNSNKEYFLSILKHHCLLIREKFLLSHGLISLKKDFLLRGHRVTISYNMLEQQFEFDSDCKIVPDFYKCPFYNPEKSYSIILYFQQNMLYNDLKNQIDIYDFCTDRKKKLLMLKVIYPFQHDVPFRDKTFKVFIHFCIKALTKVDFILLRVQKAQQKAILLKMSGEILLNFRYLSQKNPEKIQKTLLKCIDFENMSIRMDQKVHLYTKRFMAKQHFDLSVYKNNKQLAFDLNNVNILSIKEVNTSQFSNLQNSNHIYLVLKIFNEIKIFFLGQQVIFYHPSMETSLEHIMSKSLTFFQASIHIDCICNQRHAFISIQTIQQNDLVSLSSYLILRENTQKLKILNNSHLQYNKDIGGYELSGQFQHFIEIQNERFDTQIINQMFSNDIPILLVKDKKPFTPVKEVLNLFQVFNKNKVSLVYFDERRQNLPYMLHNKQQEEIFNKMVTEAGLKNVLAHTEMKRKHTIQNYMNNVTNKILSKSDRKNHDNNIQEIEEYEQINDQEIQKIEKSIASSGQSRK